MAAGLPTEGTGASLPRAGTVARSDVPTCRPDERLGDLRKRVSQARSDACVVVNEEQVVLGLLRREQLAGGKEDDFVKDVMLVGPSTFRPYVSIEEMANLMLEHDLESCPVTTSDGRLVGLLRVDDAARAAHEQHAQPEEAS
ncbi:MAG TPA: CBS domain-containing protein [Actinomycetota bacterium]|jgi:Mg/Co/Ni transporter MgtE|nr:CBS domain-containing protein [Actinomycetota bacterium]